MVGSKKTYWQCILISLCKSIWNFHYRNYQTFSHENNPKIVAEFGTGASLGSLIAAIKDNINHVIGLDLVPYADNYTLNKKLVDEIVPIKISKIK